MSQIKYQQRANRRRVTKSTPRSVTRKFFRNNPNWRHAQNAIQYPSEEQQRVAADRHHSLIAAGAAQVHDSYYLTQEQYAEVEKKVLSVREDADVSIAFTAKSEDMVKNPDGTTTITNADLQSVRFMSSPKQCSKVSQMQMEARALRKKGKAACFALMYDCGAQQFAKNVKRHAKERHAFEMKRLRRIRHLAHAGKAPHK
jgi:hypothetical protein